MNNHYYNYISIYTNTWEKELIVLLFFEINIHVHADKCSPKSGQIYFYNLTYSKAISVECQSNKKTHWMNNIYFNVHVMYGINVSHKLHLRIINCILGNTCPSRN